MGQVILLAFIAAGVVWLMIVSWGVGYAKGMEDLERDYEEIEQEVDSSIDVDRYRKHRRGSRCAADPIRWDIEPPEFLRECLRDR